jgi:succinate-semialdehyde dehydrogenase/glutarate-semialdehyde dehydrogenase
MSFKSINPKNGKLIKSFESLTDRRLQEKLELSFKTFKFMKNQGQSGLQDRMSQFENVKKLLQERKQGLAELITTEMGKTLKESVGEIDKSISMIDFFNKNTEKYLEEEQIPSKYRDAVVVQQPWGPSLSKQMKCYLIDILPWNFPIWLPFKIGLPALIAGNPVLLKHSPSTP